MGNALTVPQTLEPLLADDVALRLTVYRVLPERPPTLRSIKRQFEAFAAGFKILCDGPAIRLFNACEVSCAARALTLAPLHTHRLYVAAQSDGLRHRCGLLIPACCLLVPAPCCWGPAG